MTNRIDNTDKLKSIIESSEDNKGYSPDNDPNIITNNTGKGKDIIDEIFNLSEETQSFRISPKSDLRLRILSIEELTLAEELITRYVETSNLERPEIVNTVKLYYGACITLCMAATKKTIKRGKNLYDISKDSELSLKALIESPSVVVTNLYSRYKNFVSSFDPIEMLPKDNLDKILEAIKSNKVAISDLSFDESTQLIQYLVESLSD